MTKAARGMAPAGWFAGWPALIAAPPMPGGLDAGKKAAVREGGILKGALRGTVAARAQARKTEVKSA